MTFQRPTDQQIRNRANEIFVKSDCLPGHDIDNWLQAEYELMQWPVRKVAELTPQQTTKANRAKASLVNLVHAAMVLGASGMTQHLRR